MAIIKTNPQQLQQADYLRLHDLLALCISHWKWFLVSLVIFVSLATAYLLTTAPVYTRTASLLIKENTKKGGMLSESQNVFDDIDLFSSSTNVRNELIGIQSPDLLAEVINRLHLDVNYMTDGRFHQETLYGRKLPIQVTLSDMAYNDNCSFCITINKNRSLLLSDFVFNGKEVSDSSLTARLGKEVMTPVGRLTVSTTPVFQSVAKAGMKVYVTRSSLLSSISRCSGKMTAKMADSRSTIIDITYTDVDIQRAEDFLNTLISVYNENWVKDRNQIAVSTSQFINERLQVIESELGHVDSDISSYKSANLIPDVEAASKMYMNTANQANVQATELNNQLYMARYVRDYMNNKQNKDQLLPVNSGISSREIEQQINAYNTKQLQRNSLVANSSTTNPLVVDMDEQLKQMHDAIISSIDNEVTTLNTKIRGMRSIEGQSTSRMASNPTQTKFLLSVERQQKVKEALYLFLLQKREENELSQAFTAYNTRVITQPTGTLAPTAPDRRRILLGAILIGLILPIILVYVRESLNTKIRGRKDIEKLNIPFVGEIPQHDHRKSAGRHFLTGKLKHKDDEHYEILVKPKNRNIINEAFRVVRTNIESVVNLEKSCKVIMLTSLNSGSGKTFLTMNIAKSFAIKGYKVAAVDLDLRRASLSQYADNPKQGLADYLNHDVPSWQELIVSLGTEYPVDVIPVGTIPRNPTELLFSEELPTMIAALREQYDLVFFDCPPVEIVADTTIIARWADTTLFVIRAGLMERDMLPVMAEYYENNKFKQMLMLLNGTIAAGSSYSVHRNSFQYGYKGGYGYYGYGYGYGYHHDKE